MKVTRRRLLGLLAAVPGLKFLREQNDKPTEMEGYHRNYNGTTWFWSKSDGPLMRITQQQSDLLVERL